MNRIVGIFFIFLVFGCALEKQSIIISNPSEFERMDEPVIISRKQLKVPQNKNLLPCLRDAKGQLIPTQVDTIFNQSDWDELVFLVNLQPNERKSLTIDWVQNLHYPKFKKRTNIHFGILNGETMKIENKTSFSLGRDLIWKTNKTPYPFQMDGVAWENDKMGFRHYFDGRNSRDVFGKRVPDMVLDTVGIRPDGLPGDTYHTLAMWGRDIYSCANSFGLGGIGLWSNGQFCRLGIESIDTVNNIDQTTFRIITEGPIRSVFKIDYQGWQTPLGKINLSHKTTIWAGKIGYESEILSNELPKGSYLITGIVTNFNDRPVIEERFGGEWSAMITHDKQSYNKEYYMGLALLFPKMSLVNTFNLNEIDTWCAKLRPISEKYRYNVYSTWKMQDAKSTDSEYFVGLIEHEAKKMSEPLNVIIE